MLVTINTHLLQLHPRNKAAKTLLKLHAWIPAQQVMCALNIGKVMPNVAIAVVAGYIDIAAYSELFLQHGSDSQNVNGLPGADIERPCDSGRRFQCCDRGGYHVVNVNKISGFSAIFKDIDIPI